MTKQEEYNKAHDEFNKYFEAEIKALDKSTKPDSPANKKTAEELYNDLQNFKKNHPQFDIRRRFDSEIFTEIEIYYEVFDNCRFKYENRICLYKERNGEPNLPKNIMHIGLRSHFSYHFIDINIDSRLNFIYRYLDLCLSAQNSEKINQLKELDKEAKEEGRQKKIEQKNERAKQERILELQSKSAEEWIKSAMKNNGYSYRIDKSTNNKLTLFVKINEKLQLEIPIYYESFQEIVPLIPETIKQYETLIKENKIKVLINNLPPYNYDWINDK